jgi:hypothetical protein
VATAEVNILLGEALTLFFAVSLSKALLAEAKDMKMLSEASSCRQTSQENEVPNHISIRHAIEG